VVSFQGLGPGIAQQRTARVDCAAGQDGMAHARSHIRTQPAIAGQGRFTVACACAYTYSCLHSPEPLSSAEVVIL